MTAEKCRAKARELEAQARPPMLEECRAAFLAQARYLRDHADRLEGELTPATVGARRAA